jgi:hypothetical protein
VSTVGYLSTTSSDLAVEGAADWTFGQLSEMLKQATANLLLSCECVDGNYREQLSKKNGA